MLEPAAGPRSLRLFLCCRPAADLLQAAHLLQGWQKAGMLGVKHLDERVDIPICDRVLHSIRLHPIQGDESHTTCRHTAGVLPDVAWRHRHAFTHSRMPVGSGVAQLDACSHCTKTCSTQGIGRCKVQFRAATADTMWQQLPAGQLTFAPLVEVPQHLGGSGVRVHHHVEQRVACRSRLVCTRGRWCWLGAEPVAACLTQLIHVVQQGNLEQHIVHVPTSAADSLCRSAEEHST